MDTPHAPSQPRHVEVVGRARVVRSADRAEVVVPLRAEGGDAGAVVAAVAHQQSRLAALLGARDTPGPGPDDVTTSQVGVHPRWRDDGRQQLRVRDGWTATAHATVAVGDVGSLPALLHDLAEADLPSSDVRWSRSDTAALARRARQQAVADADVRADDLARAAGLRLGEVLSLVEDDAAPFPSPVRAMRAEGPGLELDPADVVVEARVRVVRRLLDGDGPTAASIG